MYPRLDGGRHGSRRIAFIVGIEACLVAMRVEHLANRIDTLEPMPGEGVEKAATGCLDASQEAGEARLRASTVR